MIKIGYKVVKVDDGRLMSIIAKGKAMKIYKPGVWHTGRKFKLYFFPHKEVRLPLLLFDNEENAKKFISDSPCQFKYQIWKAEYVESNLFIPAIISSDLYDGFYIPEPEGENSWPCGTIFAKKLRLVQCVYES